MYEEKSTREIASQVGLSENATLQLIFRARAAFKKALLGDGVDTSGMSVSAILSVAARKAAHEAKKVGAQAMVLVLFMVLAVGAFVNIGNRNQQSVIAEGDRNAVTAAPEASASPSETAAASPSASVPAASPSSSASPSESEEPTIGIKVASYRIESSPAPSPFSAAQVSRIYTSNPTSAGSLRAASLGTSNLIEIFDVYDALGNHAVVRINNGVEPTLESAMFDFTIDGVRYFAFLQDTNVTFSNQDGVSQMRLTGVVKLPFDEAGRVWDKSALAGTRVDLNLNFGSNVGKAASAVFSVTAPNK
jgi:RNA polymerase sigma-70 factor (ECF subfamily)